MQSPFWQHAGRFWIFVHDGVQPVPALGRCPSSQGMGHAGMQTALRESASRGAGDYVSPANICAQGGEAI